MSPRRLSGKSIESMAQWADDCRMVAKIPALKSGGSYEEHYPRTLRSGSQHTIQIEGSSNISAGDEPERIKTEDEAPYHIFGPRLKVLLVGLVSAVATLSGLSSNIYFPAQSEISKDLGVTSEMVNLSITTYMIAQGLAPSFWGVYADHKGRRATFIFTLTLYVGSNIALALSTNGVMLLVFRAVQAIGSSSTIALGAGVIADLYPAGKRAAYLGWFSGIRQFSLAGGPIIGGLLVGSFGWRSIFWFLTAFSALSLLLVIILLPETLRRFIGNGSRKLSNWTHRPALWSLIRPDRAVTHLSSTAAIDHVTTNKSKSATQLIKESFSLFLELDIFCALIFGGCVYTAWSMMIASTTYALQSVYGFNTRQIGFCFLANGLGCIVGSIAAGRSLNADFDREAKLWQHANGVHHETPFPRKKLPISFPLEHARLARGLQFSIVAIWALLLYGWSLTAPGPSDDPKAHWITPLLAQFAVGACATSVLTSNNALLVDLYPDKSASASAMLNLGRCLLGAAGVALVDPFIRKFGPGWTSVLFAGIVAVGLVPYSFHYAYGQYWREKRETARIDARTSRELL